MGRYHAQQPAPTAGAVIPDTLEEVAREGARRMLQRTLEIEVDVALGRSRYAPGGAATGYRNGHGRPREIGIGTLSVEVRPPRISDLPAGAEPFASALLPKRRYLSQDTQRLFARLYLEGLSSGDFEPAFRELLGEKAPLSASTIIVAKRARVRENALYLVFKIVERLGQHWRVLNGGATVMTLVLTGQRFVDGVLVKATTTRGGASGLITSSRKGVSTQLDESSGGRQVRDCGRYR